MSFTINGCESRSDRVTYQTTEITDTSLFLNTAFGPMAFSGTIALRPLASDGMCEGVLILTFAQGILQNINHVVGRAIGYMNRLILQQRKYRVSYFFGKDIYYAASKFAGGCATACDECEKIWNIGESESFATLTATEEDAPNYINAIPLAYRAKLTTKAPCDDNLDFLKLNESARA